MEPLSTIFYLCMIALFWYVLLKKDIIFRLLKDKSFKCRRCGRCCRLLVKLSKDDIKRISAKGHKGFVQREGIGPCFKRKDGYCVFMRMSKGKASCSIYPYRPDICKTFPRKKGFFIKEVWDQRCRSFPIPEIFRWI